MRTSFWISPPRSRVTGLPVHFATAAALASRHRVPGGLDPLLDLADPGDALLLRLPARLEGGPLVLELGELRVDLRQALARDGVVVARHGDALDLELHDAPLDLVDRLRRRVDRHPAP